MKYWLIVIFYTLLFGALGFSMFSCSHRVEPDATSIELGTVENGSEKTTKKIKQSWKWSRD